MFRLTAKEWTLMRSQIVTASVQEVQNHININMRSQIVTSSSSKRRADLLPFAFTEHGVTMLASVLKSERAIKMSIAVVRAFIELKRAATQFKELSEQLELINNTWANTMRN